MNQQRVPLQSFLKEAQDLQAQGKNILALQIYERILAEHPAHPQVLGLCGQLNLMLGRGPDARRILEKAVAIDPGNSSFLNMLAMGYRLGNQFAKAHECLDRALLLSPGEPSFLATRAELHLLAGDADKAIEALEPCLKSTEVNTNATAVFARVAPKFNRTDEAALMVERCLKKTDLEMRVRSQLHFALGDLRNLQSRDDDAMNAWHKANQFRQMTYNAPAFAGAVDHYLRLWNRSGIAAFPRSTMNSDLMVFVVGMPRSGTTLVEQILSSVPGVFGGNERGNIPAAAFEINTLAIAGIPLIVNTKNINAEVVQRLAKNYVDQIHALAPGTLRFIDKNPMNFALLGLVQLMFPRARVIHCTRNPMDTCLSCYTRNFSGHLPWAYSLTTLGHFYQQYRRIMEHWHRELDLELIDVEYERLVEDTEAQARRLVDFIGVPWSDSCLTFHESKRMVLTASYDQVRQPIYATSMNKYAKYGSHLDPLRTALGDCAPR